MTDPTEYERRKRLAEIDARPQDRAALEAHYGQVWDTRELARDFIVVGFLAPYLVVKRKRDEAKGSLEFQANPRFYFNFVAD